MMDEPSGYLPLIPFLDQPDAFVFIFLVLARVSGLFLVSPLLSHSHIPGTAKAFLTLFTTALMAMVLYPHYLGPHPKHSLGIDPNALNLVATGLLFGKELCVGFIVGFVFNLVFEALMLAGQFVGVVIGFSMAEILDPVSGSSQGIVSNLFILTATLMMLCLDLHHVFFRVGAESFALVPMGTYHLPREMLEDLTAGTGRTFTYAIQFAAIPYVILLLITFGLGYMAKVMPEMNIFMVGFPLRIFIGYFGLIYAITHFPLLLQQAFVEFNNLAGILLRHIAG